MSFLKRPLIAFLAGVLVGAGALLLLADPLEGDEDSAPKLVAQATKGAPVTAEAALQLGKRFRPILRFDSREPWRPLEVGAFFAERSGRLGRHLVCRPARGADDCEEVAGLSDFVRLGPATRRLGEGGYLDIAGGKANGRDFRSPALAGCTDRTTADCNAGDRSAIYYNVIAANRRFYVDYWWFFRYNDFSRIRLITRCDRHLVIECGDHEGDWEGVTVVTTNRPPYALEYVAFASHEGVFRYPRGGVERRGERPLVYVARGSHAAYPKACRGRDCRQLNRLRSIRRPEERYDGRSPWGRNADSECERGVSCLQPLPRVDVNPETSWNAFAGRWGLRCPRVGRACPVEQGPKSPSRQERYREPWCFRVGKRKSCDAPTPGTSPEATAGLATETDCEAWLGQLASVAICDRERIAAALRPNGRAAPRGLRLATGGASASDRTTPGVAQITGAPLAPGARLTIEGVASPVTTLTVRAATGRAVSEARFTELGLETGGTAIVTVGARDGVPTLRLEPPRGGPIEPQELRSRRLG